jgi:hypothetical protein
MKAFACVRHLDRHVSDATHVVGLAAMDGRISEWVAEGEQLEV